MKNLTLHPQTLSFLQWLDDFNDKKFFNLYKDLYLQIKEQFEHFVQHAINEISKFDPDLKDELAKNAIFRIYKDCRRPINRERPYKINLWAFISQNWRKSDFAWYYLHIQNNQSFLSVGTRRPKPHFAYKIREKIYTNYQEFKNIINDKKFIDTFDPIQSFNEELKKPNRNSKYSKILWNISDEDPSLEFIKMKNWLCHRSLSNSKLLDDDFLQNFVETAKLGYKFKSFLSDI